MPRRHRAAQLTAFLTILLPLQGALVAGCAVGPDYRTPELEVPDAWHRRLVADFTAGDAGAEWWGHLDDQGLAAVVEQARSGNHRLRAAAERVEMARALRIGARADFFPGVDMYASTARTKLSGEAIPTPERGERRSSVYSLGWLTSWEIDLFGRVRRSAEAADADTDAAVEDYRDLLVALSAEAGRHYVELRTLQARRAFASANVAIQAETLDLVAQRNRAGLVGELDVRQAELSLARTTSMLPVLDAERAAIVNATAVLLGVFPAELPPTLRADGDIPRPPERVLVGVPGDLVRRRPDLRRAERRLAAETARIGVATADLYPRLSLVGTFSFDALRAARTLHGDASGYGFGPSVQWNLFDAGRIRSRIRAQRSQAAAALADYEHTLREAVAEVESAMDAYVREEERARSLRASADAAQRSVDTVLTLYRSGLADFQRVLDSQRALFEQQDALATSRGQRVKRLIQIYAALGGGWAS